MAARPWFPSLPRREGRKGDSGDPLPLLPACRTGGRHRLRRRGLNRPSIYAFNELGLNKDNAETVVKMVDPYTMQIVVGQAFAPDLVLATLSFVATAVVDPGVVEQHLREGELGSDWLKDHSAGSGPYQLIRWERNDVVDMVAYAGYWRGIPPIKRIVIRDIPEASAQRIALEKGDIDVAWGLSPQMRQEIRTAKTPGLAIIKVPGHGIDYMGMNAKYGPLAKEQVREAIRYAIDYAAIRDGIMRGEAIPLHVLPMTLSVLIVQLTLRMGTIILTAAGLGAQPPTPEWGAMVSDGRNFLVDQWWMSTLPGSAIAAAVLGFNLLGDGIRDILDPRLRR